MMGSKKITISCYYIHGILSTLLLFASLGSAFQQQTVANGWLYQSKRYRRRYPLHYAPTTDQSIIASNRQYLRDVLGFSEEKLDKIAAKESGGNILNREIGILDDRAKWLKNRLGLNDYEMKKIILSQPTILNIPSESDLGLESKINWLQKRLALDQKSLTKMITRSPPIMTISIKDNVQPTLDWLQERLMLDGNVLNKMVTRSPSILLLSIEGNVKPTLEWLQERLQLDDYALSKLIQRLPQILSFSITENVEPKLDWLQDRLKLDDNSLAKLIQRMPQTLCLSIHDNLEPKLDWLQQRLSLTDVALTKMIRRLPGILSTSTDILEDKLVWLQKRLSLTDEQLSKMVQRLPSLVCSNIPNNLEPTLNFYINALGDESTAISFVTNNPSSLGVSLEKRLKPRLEEAQSIGMKIDYTCLYYIWRDTNDQWNERVIMCVANELCRY